MALSLCVGSILTLIVYGLLFWVSITLNNFQRRFAQSLFKTSRERSATQLGSLVFQKTETRVQGALVEGRRTVKLRAHVKSDVDLILEKQAESDAAAIRLGFTQDQRIGHTAFDEKYRIATPDIRAVRELLGDSNLKSSLLKLLNHGLISVAVLQGRLLIDYEEVGSSEIRDQLLADVTAKLNERLGPLRSQRTLASLLFGSIQIHLREPSTLLLFFYLLAFFASALFAVFTAFTMSRPVLVFRDALFSSLLVTSTFAILGRGFFYQLGLSRKQLTLGFTLTLVVSALTVAGTLTVLNKEKPRAMTHVTGQIVKIGRIASNLFAPTPSETRRRVALKYKSPYTGREEKVSAVMPESKLESELNLNVAIGQLRYEYIVDSEGVTVRP